MFQFCMLLVAHFLPWTNGKLYSAMANKTSELSTDVKHVADFVEHSYWQRLQHIATFLFLCAMCKISLDMWTVNQSINV